MPQPVADRPGGQGQSECWPGQVAGPLGDDFAAGPARNLDAAVDAGGRLVTCCFAAAIPAAFLRVTVIVSGSDLATRLEFQRDRELDVEPPQIVGRISFVLVLAFGGRIETSHT